MSHLCYVNQGSKKGQGWFVFLHDTESFPYETQCECYKKVASRLRPILFTVTSFFLSHTHSSILWQNKKLLSLLLSLAT